LGGAQVVGLLLAARILVSGHAGTMVGFGVIGLGAFAPGGEQERRRDPRELAKRAPDDRV
jgi:hypothetical protein